MSEIKNKIIDLFDSAEKKNISYNNLEYILDEILSGNENHENVYLFLDLLHLSSISKVIAKNNNCDYWALKIADIIEKYNFHTGQLLWQRVKRYKETPVFISIAGEKKQTITYNKFWNDLILTFKSFHSLSEKDTIALGILSFNQYKSALVDLCCLAFGYRVVPIPLNSTSEHLSYILEEAEITHLFVGGDKATQLWNSVHKGYSIKIIDINDIGSVKGESISWEYFQDLGEKSDSKDYDLSILNRDMSWTSTIM